MPYLHQIKTDINRARLKNWFDKIFIGMQKIVTMIFKRCRESTTQNST